MIFKVCSSDCSRQRRSSVQTTVLLSFSPPSRRKWRGLGYSVSYFHEQKFPVHGIIPSRFPIAPNRSKWKITEFFREFARSTDVIIRRMSIRVMFDIPMAACPGSVHGRRANGVHCQLRLTLTRHHFNRKPVGWQACALVVEAERSK